MDNIKIDIVSSADKCQLNNACNDLNKHTLCNVTENINNEVIFVSSGKCHCNYNITFGYKEVCTCPIRKEIYLKCNV